jgi:GH15 family glucan-1,4-alpha-glucosidase
MAGNKQEAPGRPGIEPRWTSSAKSGVGASAGTGSRVWFTVSHGILDEIYSPEVDRACTRDLGFIVTDGNDFFSEEKRDTKHTVEYLAPGVPAFRLINECESGRYKIEKEIVTDPDLDVVLVRTKFFADKSDQLFLFALLAPHLGNGGAHNDAWIDTLWGDTFCLAAHNAAALALTAQIDLAKCGGEFVLALGFDASPTGAVHHVRASLLDGFDAACDEYVREWKKWQKPLQAPPRAGRTVSIITASVRRYCTLIRLRNFRAGSWRAFPFRGVLPKAMPIAAVTIWFGCAIWRRSRAGCWRRARRWARRGCCVFSLSLRKPMAVGHKICG